jgi:hypothetical protein
MDFGMAWTAYREQIARQLLEDTDVGEVMDLGWRPLAALLALPVGTLENVLAPLAPEVLAEVPAVGSFTIIFLHAVLLLEKNFGGALSLLRHPPDRLSMLQPVDATVDANLNVARGLEKHPNETLVS